MADLVQASSPVLQVCIITFELLLERCCNFSLSIQLLSQAIQQTSNTIHEVALSEAGLNAAARYRFTIHQEVCWLHQVMTDPRLLQGFKNLLQSVSLGQVPYAPMLALNYQLGGKIKFPSPEVRWAAVVL